MKKTRKLPFCFSDYRPRDRSCNGSRHRRPCAVRNQCSAFGIVLKEREQRREEFLIVHPSHTRESRPGLLEMLNREVVRLKITDGLQVIARRGTKSRAKSFAVSFTAMEVCAWFVHRLGVESKRRVAMRMGMAEIGDLFTVGRRDGCVIRCRVDAVQCVDVCEVSLRRRERAIEIESGVEVVDSLTRRESQTFRFEIADQKVRFFGVDQVESSALAMRISSTCDLPRCEA